jgi:hypothetical protein
MAYIAWQGNVTVNRSIELKSAAGGETYHRYIRKTIEITTGTANARLVLWRVTGALSSAGASARTNTRSRNPSATSGVTGTVTTQGNPLLIIGTGCVGGNFSEWRSPRPWAAPHCINGEFIHLQWPVVAATIGYAHHVWEEASPRFDPHRSRRPRRNGYWPHRAYENRPALGVSGTGAVNRRAEHAWVSAASPFRSRYMRPSKVLLDPVAGISISDTGLTVTDATATARTRLLTVTGLTILDGIATGNNQAAFVTDTGLTASDSLQKTATHSLAATGVTVSDSLASVRGRLTSTTGLTVTDATATARAHLVADTGMSFNDGGLVVRVNGVIQVSLTDTGLVVSDSISLMDAASLADTGLAVTDAITSAPTRQRLPIDTLTFSDSLDKPLVVKFISDTGLSVTDTLRRDHPTAITTTGVTISDTLARGNPHRVISDTGLTLSFGFAVQVNGHNAQVQITDAGLSVSGSITKAVTRPVGIYEPDTGLAIHDGLRVRTTPPFTPTKPQADFTWTRVGLTVNFTDTSTPGSAPIGSWDWGFGDGSTSSATNPVHTYSTPGTYNVSLRVTTIYGASSVTKPVTVSSGVLPPGFHLDAVVV